MTDKWAFPLVHVEWLDSFGVGPEWTEFESMGEDVEVRCTSVGYIVKETEKYILVVPHLHGDMIIEGLNKKITASGCGDMAIPKCSIVKQTAIVLPDYSTGSET